MSAAVTDCRHITVNLKTRAVIVGTGMRVTQLVMEKQAHGWSPEELCYQHPHLTLGQVYSALAFYADHHEELDATISAELNTIEKYRKRVKQAKIRREASGQGAPLHGISIIHGPPCAAGNYGCAAGTEGRFSFSFYVCNTVSVRKQYLNS